MGHRVWVDRACASPRSSSHLPWLTATFLCSRICLLLPSRSILLYEMLCGMPPFRAKSRNALQTQITSAKVGGWAVQQPGPRWVLNEQIGCKVPAEMWTDCLGC